MNQARLLLFDFRCVALFNA